MTWRLPPSASTTSCRRRRRRRRPLRPPRCPGRPGPGARACPAARGSARESSAHRVAGEVGEERVEHGQPVDVGAGLVVERGRQAGQLRGEHLGPRHVEPEADDDRRDLPAHDERLGQDAGQLAVADEQVVGPLQLGAHPGHLLARGRGRERRRPGSGAAAGRRRRGARGRAATGWRRAARSPRGASQRRPSRPRPAVWWSATRTVPKAAPDAGHGQEIGVGRTGLTPHA